MLEHQLYLRETLQAAKMLFLVKPIVLFGWAKWSTSEWSITSTQHTINCENEKLALKWNYCGESSRPSATHSFIRLSWSSKRGRRTPSVLRDALRITSAARMLGFEGASREHQMKQMIGSSTGVTGGWYWTKGITSLSNTSLCNNRKRSKGRRRNSKEISLLFGEAKVTTGK